MAAGRKVAVKKVVEPKAAGTEICPYFDLQGSRPSLLVLALVLLDASCAQRLIRIGGI
jgi:hypothetical protein